MLVFTIYHLVTLSVCADQGSAVPTLLIVIAADGLRDSFQYVFDSRAAR
jgi:hypothetical protein